MGNTILSADMPLQLDKGYKLSKQRQQQQYNYISDPMVGITGKPRLVKSAINNLQLQQYYISNPETTTEFDINVYKLRSSSYSKNIVVVFHHKLLDQAEKLFMVRIQKMKGRLNQFQGLNITQGLCILQAALNGYSQLIYHAKTPFVITEKMIAINQNPQVRVWLNENFSINKIMPGIKIRNQNIMVHQAFSAVCQHTSLEQRQAFSQIRFKIAQCQRLVDAKNIITMILQNCNRKAILQQLVEKHMARVSRMNGMMIHNNGPINHQNTNIKVPMNYPGPGPMQNGIFYNPGPPISTVTPITPITAVNPISNNHGQNGPYEKIQIMPEQYIKDDQGLDRIRMVRNEYVPAKVSSYITSATIPGINPYNQNFVAKNPTQNITSNPNDQPYVDKSIPRNKSIFGKNKLQQVIDMKRVASPRFSPIKQKNMDYNSQNKSKTTMATKIGESQIKIGNLSQKINKLKHQFNKTTQPPRQKQYAPYVGTIRVDKNTQRLRPFITPPHYNQNKSPINEDIHFNNRNQKERIKTQTTIGQLPSQKWNRKLSQLRDNQNAQNMQPNYNQNIQFFNEKQAKRNQKKSQIFMQEANHLRRSLVDEHSNKNNEFGLPPNHINFQSNLQRPRNRDNSPRFNRAQKQLNQNNTSTFNLNTNTPKFTNGAYNNNNLPQFNGTHPKMNINFINGNPYTNQVPNIYNGGGYPNPNIMQNKSFIVNRRSHI